MEKKVSYIKPCDTGEGKLIAEVIYGRESQRECVFNPKLLCEKISGHPSFSGVKCSLKLGMAGFTFEGKSVVANKSGRIVVRMAEDEKDALAAADYVVGVILGGG